MEKMSFGSGSVEFRKEFLVKVYTLSSEYLWYQQAMILKEIIHRRI